MTLLHSAERAARAPPRADCPWRRLGAVRLIRKRTMHHAETSLASFSRLADVAVLAL